MSAVQEMMVELEGIFVEMDAKVAADSQAWAEKKCAALMEFKASEEYQKLRRDAWTVYPMMFNMCGGKTWYQIFSHGYNANVAEFMVKNSKAIADRRNAKIANKLIKSGVTEVLSKEYVYSSNGFDGVFRVMTDKGEKRVVINSIYAGGWNIQCFHIRVLVSVK